MQTEQTVNVFHFFIKSRTTIFLKILIHWDTLIIKVPSLRVVVAKEYTIGLELLYNVSTTNSQCCLMWMCKLRLSVWKSSSRKLPKPSTFPILLHGSHSMNCTMYVFVLKFRVQLLLWHVASYKLHLLNFNTKTSQKIRVYTALRSWTSCSLLRASLIANTTE